MIRTDWADREAQAEGLVPNQALDLAFQMAANDAVLLLEGEKGTGKRALAEAIHARSPQAHGPFVMVDCAGTTALALDRDLYGGPGLQAPPGKVALAEGGTLLLQSAEAIPPGSIPALRRLLRDRQYAPTGSEGLRACRVRFLLSMTRSREADLLEGRAGDDLLAGLSVVVIHLAPLRHRPGDLLPLAHHLLTLQASRLGKTIHGFTPQAQELITRYPWPGNGEELREAIARAVHHAMGLTIDVPDLPETLLAYLRARIEVGSRVTLEQLEAEHIRLIMESTDTVDEAAGILGIDPSTLYRKRKRHRL